MPYIKVQEADFSIDDVVNPLRADNVGAVVTFFGTVRNFAPDGAAVSGMTWECYESMAEKSLLQIAEQAILNFKLHDVGIVHRVGERAVGDSLVLIACASEHRQPAFEACAWIMDEIKLNTPLWKKEHLVEGESRWVGYDRHERNTTTPEYD